MTGCYNISRKRINMLSLSFIHQHRLGSLQDALKSIRLCTEHRSLNVSYVILNASGSNISVVWNIIDVPSDPSHILHRFICVGRPGVK